MRDHQLDHYSNSYKHMCELKKTTTLERANEEVEAVEIDCKKVYMSQASVYLQCE